MTESLLGSGVSGLGAYAGVRVVDFTQGVAGPMAAMMLGDFGAEVIKIEPPVGDRGGDAPGYLAFNRNKQVARLDLETHAGMAAARTLLAGADVALFDGSPKRQAALDLSAQALTSGYPSLVHAWMPPYAAKGRWSELAPRHSLLSALSGWCWRQGATADQPVHMVTPFAWYGQAVMACSAIGAALLERARSGCGQGVVVSGLHGFAHVGGPTRILSAPRPPRATPQGANPRSRLYRCADGQFLFLCAFFPSFYRQLFETLGYADLTEALLVDDEAARNLLDEVFATAPCDEWTTRLMAAGVPCAPVGARETWLAGEAVGQAGLRISLQHPEFGEVAMPGPPAALSATPMRVQGLPERIAEPPAWPAKPPPLVTKGARRSEERRVGKECQ